MRFLLLSQSGKEVTYELVSKKPSCQPFVNPLSLQFQLDTLLRPLVFLLAVTVFWGASPPGQVGSKAAPQDP